MGYVSLPEDRFKGIYTPVRSSSWLENGPFEDVLPYTTSTIFQPAIA